VKERLISAAWVGYEDQWDSFDHLNFDDMSWIDYDSEDEEVAATF
jgi:hypothetical protein